MAINWLELKNFTVFKDITVNFINGINVIIGENGTGKTHLLKLLYTLNLGFDRHTDKNGSWTDRANEWAETKEIDNILDESLSKVFDIDFPYLNDNFKATRFFIVNPFNHVIFIPAKEMLSHAKGLLSMKKKYGENMPFDITLLDIIEKAQAWKLKEMSDLAKNIAPKIEKLIDGVVEIKDDGSFWVKKSNGTTIPFSMEAEGLKRFGLMWQLLMNESITNNTVLLWDEPEANINPKLIPDLVEIMLELSRNGVQIFIATHDYILAKYFEVRRKENDSVRFHSLYKTDDGVKCESNENFRDLKDNSIIAAFDVLMDEVIDRNMGD